VTDAPPLTAAQARALAAPTRRAILAHLAEEDRAVSVAELNERLGLNHNAVRKHLAQLGDAGLVVEARETRTTPGRPRLLYRLAPGSPGGIDQPYRRLAVLLATVLASGEDPADVGRRAASAGSALPADLAPVDALTARFAAEGFEPSVRRRGGRTEIVLDQCPFADAATANASAVCRLHLGLAEGAADAIGGLRVDGLTPKDPRRGGCRLAVTETAT
jgi:predicted ArsR family transcriptional regulator